MKGKKNGFGNYLHEMRSGAGWSLRKLSYTTKISFQVPWCLSVQYAQCTLGRDLLTCVGAHK